MIVDCRECVHWFDCFLDENDERCKDKKEKFYGCEIYGYIADFDHRKDCKYYREREELFAICKKCGLTVPRRCILMGECNYCVNSEMYCLENCSGGKLKKFCTYYVKLSSEGKEITDGKKIYTVRPENYEMDREHEKKKNKLSFIFEEYLKKKKLI